MLDGEEDEMVEQKNRKRKSPRFCSKHIENMVSYYKILLYIHFSIFIS